jgi:hypothetical protein
VRIIAACALALMLGSCAAEEHKPFVPNVEQNDAVARYSLCLLKAAKASDDHISDAATIGLAILPMYTGDYQGTMSALTKDMSLGAKAAFLRQENTHRLELATAAVVKSRQQQ